jgi:hypothetical protein
LHLTFTRRRPHTLAYFDLGVVNVRQHLADIDTG